MIDLGSTLRSIALARFDSREGLLEEVEDFVARVAVPLFVGVDGQVRVFTSMGSASLSGMSNLFVPLLIAALIVLNTMLGAVYERSAEIGVYSSVGLAPGHISSLFIAESMVFAVTGAVLGYLVGQTTTLLMTHYDLLVCFFFHSALCYNVDSHRYGDRCLIYPPPRRKAASMSVPDVTRRWKFPEPNGDLWTLIFLYPCSE